MNELHWKSDGCCILYRSDGSQYQPDDMNCCLCTKNILFPLILHQVGEKMWGTGFPLGDSLLICQNNVSVALELESVRPNPFSVHWSAAVRVAGNLEQELKILDGLGI